MKASWGKSDNNQGILEIEVEEKEVANALDQAFKKVVKDVNVPGFRKGKVPRQIFEQRFGIEALYNDALDILLPISYDQAVKETEIEPVAPPEIDIVQFEKGKPFIFKATVTVMPEVKLGIYKGIEIPEKDFSVKDEDIQKELTDLQSRHAELEIIVDGEVQDGDTALIDFEGFLNGEAFPGGKGEKHPLEIGSGSFIPGFEEQVVGMKKDEEKDIVVTFPENYQSEELAGKEVTFKVKLHEIKRKSLPELNDEFAKDVDFETLAELKEDIKQNIEQKAEQEKENYQKNKAVEIVTENTTIDIPQVMVEQEIERMVKEFEQQLSSQGMNIDLYCQITGQDKDKLKEQFSKDAATRVKTNLVLEAIVKEENIDISEEELEKELHRIAEMYQRDIEEIKSVLSKQDSSYENLKADIKVRKAVDMLIASSK